MEQGGEDKLKEEEYKLVKEGGGRGGGSSVVPTRSSTPPASTPASIGEPPVETMQRRTTTRYAYPSASCLSKGQGSAGTNALETPAVSDRRQQRLKKGEGEVATAPARQPSEGSKTKEL